MSMITVSAKATWTGRGPQINVQAGNHDWVVDQPEADGGKDSGPTPLELQLGALGSCLATLGFAFASSYDVDLKGLSVSVDGDLDPDGYQGLADVPFGFQEIRFRIHLDSPSPQERIQALVEHIKKICPIRSTLQGVPVKAV